MDELVIPVADDEVGLAGHRGVGSEPGILIARTLSPEFGRYAPNMVAGIEILDATRQAALRKMGGDLFFRNCQLPNVKQILSGSFGNHDDRVVVFGEPSLEFCEQTSVAVERKRHFGDECKVDLPTGERCGSPQ